MRPWTEDDELRFTVAFALRRIRPLLRRIVLETHPDEHTDPANAAADKIKAPVILASEEDCETRLEVSVEDSLALQQLISDDRPRCGNDRIEDGVSSRSSCCFNGAGRLPLSTFKRLFTVTRSTKRFFVVLTPNRES